MNKLIVDSSAWIEYLAGTDKGRKVRDLIQGAQVFTTGVIVAEVCTHFLKKGLATQDAVSVMRSSAQLVPFDFSIGQRSAELYFNERQARAKFGLADAHVAAAARMHHVKLVTCDFDFSRIPEAIIIK